MLQRETLSNGVKHPERLNHCIIYALDHLDKASRNNRQVYKEIEKDDYMGIRYFAMSFAVAINLS